VHAIDPAGNIGDDATHFFIADRTAPPAPAITTPAADALQASSTVTLSGASDEANAKIEVFDGAISKGTAATGDTGAWTVTLPGVPDGAHAYTATATDVAGNTSLASATRTITVDTTPPPADVTSGPDGPTTNTSPSFGFVAADGTTVDCKLDGPGATVGTYGKCESPKDFKGLTPGAYTFSVRAKDAAGNETVKSRAFSVTLIQQATPTPTPSPTPTPTTPTPVSGKSVVIQPVSGKTLVKLPGASRFTPVDATIGIPLGSTVDTRTSKIRLFAIPKPGQPAESALFYAGIFKVTQIGAITQLQLTEALAPCPKAAAAAAKKPKTRKLWGDGTGSFRTRGQYSAATVRGTTWLVQDSCGKTLTKVAKGVVSVQDFVKKKTVLVRAPKSYTAKR
jgi:hypothetical protein